MTPSLDALHRTLVEDWGVLSQSGWDGVPAPVGTDANRFLDHLARTIRFSTLVPIPFLTSAQRDAIVAGRANALVVQLAARKWLKIKKLGSGGQGEVWAACACEPDARSDQLVALKSPLPNADPLRARSYLLLECDALERCPGSPFIAGLVDADRVTGSFATRFVDGPTLAERIDEVRRLSVVEAVQIGIDVCRALEVVHAAGRIHMDVKPSNIVIEGGTRAVLIDFGLVLDPATARPIARGTPYYIAPEVFQASKTPDERADVYSLGATLFHALAGQPPHFQQCLHPVQYRSTQSKLDELRFLVADAALDCDLEDHRRDIPREISRLLCASLATNRDHRPASIQEFRSLLERMSVMIGEAEVVENQLWALSRSLLAVFRDNSRRNVFDAHAWANAEAMRDDLGSHLLDFPAVADVKRQRRQWSDLRAESNFVRRTVRIHTKLKALRNQLEHYLAEHPSRTTGETEVLKHLLDRTREGCRDVSLDALAAAHDWRSLRVNLGAIGA